MQEQELFKAGKRKSTRAGKGTRAGIVIRAGIRTRTEEAL
jgi:hypothetical protein